MTAPPGLRVAHLIETNGPGGAEQMLVHMVRELQAAGCYNVVVLPAGGEEWLQRQLEGLGGVVLEPFRLEQPVSAAFAGWIVELLRRHEIEIAHSHEFTMAVYGAWGARRAGIPLVTTMHGGRYYAERLRRRAALRAAFAFTAKIVAVSRILARHLCRDLWLPPSRVVTIPNGVSPADAAPPRVTLRHELGLTPADALVLSVGNLYPVKGHRYLVDALARLPRVHLAIAGRGDLAAPLRRQATELGVADRLHLLGLRSDVSELLAQADLFVLPSLSEGLPLALLEAMFAGCVIVASDVGDVRAALDDGRAGLLVLPGDGPALARAMDSLLADAAGRRALALRARQRALAEYDASRMVARYVALYRELLGGTAAPETLASQAYGSPT